ncbi:hypothetical protein [Flavicella sp.]|nr:hypothetical protein [Flavicella sp.]MDG1804309.1 hypothetical protein [Flavicella sp.]
MRNIGIALATASAAIISAAIYLAISETITTVVSQEVVSNKI